MKLEIAQDSEIDSKNSSEMTELKPIEDVEKNTIIETQRKRSYFACKKIGNYRVFFYYKDEPYYMIGPNCKIHS